MLNVKVIILVSNFLVVFPQERMQYYKLCLVLETYLFYLIIKVLEHNPHAVFLSFHIIDVGTGKRVELPPLNDGSALTSHLNKEHAEIMTKYLNSQVEEVNDLENRVSDSIEELKIRNNDVRVIFYFLNLLILEKRIIINY